MVFIMSRWKTITLETNSPKRLKNKLISKAKEDFSEEIWPQVIDDNRVVGRSETLSKLLFGEKDSTIPYKGILEVSDMVMRASIAACEDTGETARITLYDVGFDEVSVIDRVKSSKRLSDFQFEYLYHKYDFKLSQKPDIKHDFGQFDDINELYSNYDVEEGSTKSNSYREKYFVETNKEKTFGNIKEIRSGDLDSDLKYAADEEGLNKLLNFFLEKGLSLNSSSMRENFMISASYSPESNLKPVKISTDEVFETFNEEELNQYLRDVTGLEDRVSDKYLDMKVVASETLREGANKNLIPDPGKVDDISVEVHINSRCSGELQVVISFTGDIYLDSFSEKFDFIVLFSYSWISENKQEDIENIESLLKD
jgi:hypothetical protein